MRIILYRGKQNNKPLMVSPLALAQFILMVFVLVFSSLLIFSTDSYLRDFSTSGLLVILTLFISSLLIASAPHVFDIQAFQIPAFYVLFYIAILLLPLPFVYPELTFEARLPTAYALCGGFLLTLVGILITYRSFRYSKTQVKNWFTAPVHNFVSLKWMAVILLFFSLGVLALYIQQSGELPILQALRGNVSSSQLALAREDALKLIPGRIRYVFTYLRSFIFPYTTLILLVISYTTRQKKWIVLFLIALVGNFVIATATLEKSPSAVLILMLVLVYLLIRGKHLTISKLAVIGVLGLVFPAVILFLVLGVGTEGAGRVVSALVTRMLVIPIQMVYYHFAYFPEFHEFLLGQTLPFVSKLFVNGNFSLANQICLFINPTTLYQNCSANAAYIGALWADFSWFGVIIGSLLLGIILQLMQTIILIYPKTALTVVMQAMIPVSVFYLTATTLPSFLFSAAGYSTVVAIVIMTLTSRKRSLGNQVKL